MKTGMLLMIVSAVSLAAFPVSAYDITSHEEFIAKAVDGICACGAQEALCAELRANTDYLLYGARMEDQAYKGFREEFKGIVFEDEEPDRYGPCRYDGKRLPVCNHFFFVKDYLAGKEEGGCGTEIGSAIFNKCRKPKPQYSPSLGGYMPARPEPFRWESTRQRGLRLWKEKVMAWYFTTANPEAKARAYYWLGRVAHLLADTSVPGHIVPHHLDHTELEHRIYENVTEKVPIEACAARTAPPERLEDLFVSLALETLRTDGEIRAMPCQGRPLTGVCRKGRFTPTRDLESLVPFQTAFRIYSLILRQDDPLMNNPAAVRERGIAVAEAVPLKAETAVYIKKLFELFGMQAALSARDMKAPEAAAAGEGALEIEPVFY